ncbi:unnamed protein product, partial [Polarella glacialis]
PVAGDMLATCGQASSSSHPKRGRLRSRGRYSDEEKARASDFVQGLMELADHDSNVSGGAKRFRDMREELLDITPPGKRLRVEAVPFAPNKSGIHGKYLDEFIKECLDEDCVHLGSASAWAPKLSKALPATPPYCLRAAKTPSPKLISSEAATSLRGGTSPAAGASRRGLERFFGRAPAAPPSRGEEESPRKRPCAESAMPPEPEEPSGGSASGPSAAGTSGDGSSGAAGARRTDPDGHYAILRLAEGASAAEVRAAKHRRVLETHPDKGGEAEEFRAVLRAFDVLSDFEMRAKYDGKTE